MTMQMRKPRPNTELYQPLICRDQQKQFDNATANIEMQQIQPKLVYPDQHQQVKQKPRDRLVERIISSDVDHSVKVSSYPEMPYAAPSHLQEEKNMQQNIHHNQHYMHQNAETTNSSGSLYPSLQRMNTAPTMHQSHYMQQKAMWQQKQLPLHTQYIRPQNVRIQQHQQFQQRQQPQMQRSSTQVQIPRAQKCTKRIECGTCKGLMEYDSNAFLVSCPYCTSVNYTTPISILKCGACRIDFYFPLNPCPCGAINQVPNVPLKPIS